jgi:hypothetical protein
VKPNFVLPAIHIVYSPFVAYKGAKNRTAFLWLPGRFAGFFWTKYGAAADDGGGDGVCGRADEGGVRGWSGFGRGVGWGGIGLALSSAVKEGGDPSVMAENGQEAITTCE